MAEFYGESEKAMARESSLRDRVAMLEKASRELGELLDQVRAQMNRLTREVGIDEPA